MAETSVAFVGGDLILTTEEPYAYCEGSRSVETNLTEHFRTIIREEIEADRKRQRDGLMRNVVDHGNGNFSMSNAAQLPAGLIQTA